MMSFEDQYYDINRKLLTIVGLWPYQKWRFRIIQVTLCLSVLLSFLIAQLATFITSGFNISIILRVLSQAFPCLIYILKYSSFVVNSKYIKIFYERICHDWTILKVPDEVDILRKYADISRRFTIFITATMILSVNVFGLFQFLPDFLDIIIPLNESREHYLSFQAEYFIDQKRHFYTIVTHGLMAVYIGSFGVITTGCMLMGYILHICAMLKIASYRLEHINDNISPIYNFVTDHVVRERIINAVDIHRKAIELGEFFLSSFANFYFFLIGVGVLSLTVNLFQLLQFATVNDTNGTLACGCLIIAHFVYLFAGNLAGQIVTDHNINVFNATYTTQWYTVSLQAQKLLLLILRRNTKNYYFIIGGIFTASLEGFATLMSMSISYFTVIYSTR